MFVPLAILAGIAYGTIEVICTFDAFAKASRPKAITED